MKALVLSSDDIQNFSKLIYDHKAAAVAHLAATNAAAAAVANSASAAAAAAANRNNNSNNNNTNNLMALQYYLKHPGNYVTAAASAPVAHHSVIQHHHQQHQQQTAAHAHAHQQLLAQSQTQLKHLQLKQPTIHQQQHGSYHHHPYYSQQPQQQQQQTITLTSTHSHNHSHHQSQQQQQQQQHHVPVHALNQNSNFSAASSSTGGGTTSSHAPTQQSNSSSISPTVAARSSQPATANAAAAATAVAAANAMIRSSAGGNNSGTITTTTTGTSSSNCAKKLKIEPVLSQYNQTERLNFANTHIVWSEEHWKRVVFQDERKFNLDGPDGFSYYFHDLRNYERTLSQRPRGNSVFIYLLITVGGPIHMEVSTSKLKPETCIETILRERPNIVNKLGGNTDFILQDHNWMSNALPTAQEWLNAEGLKTQKWPTISHDLNIMENIWGWLIREVFEGGRKFSRKDDLIFRIREAWARLPLDLITNLYSTLPERITELYYTRGVYTNC